MEAAYQPAATEARLRRRWEEIRLGAADPGSQKPAFSIVMPPPNITGSLHMGHALNALVQDALCRYHRMRGFEVCWVPGTDHAAIATQNVIERQLAQEGTSKEAVGRDAFARRVDEWYREYQGRILEQLRRLGATCDWDRERFTLDDAYVRVIRTVFAELFRQGLVYRGPRIVNWCPRCRSAISDEEVDYREHHDAFYYVRYPLVGAEGGIEVATARPETMLADVAVAVSPGDPRFAGLLRAQVTEPLTGRQIPIVEDAAVDPRVGTGALKITPGHSAEDYEIGQRHQLPILTVVSLDGRMVAPDFPDLDGVPVQDARPLVVEMLRARGALVREEPLVHQVGHCDRCGTVIEPLVTEQWWVRVQELANPAALVVRDGLVRIHPEQFRRIYLEWVEGLRDWCVSRQLWLGHRIPVSTCGNGHNFAWVDEPQRCPECGDQDLMADPDVLDTWFSSALWPFAVLGWPEPNPALERFYPTSVLSTAREILQHWVVRMVMMGLRCTGEIPFHDVLFHATVLGADGARMAKSRGNVVDPLSMVDKYGADALRAWGASVAMGTQDSRFDETRIEGYQHFANKLWNMVRFLHHAHFPDGEGRIPETQHGGGAPATEDRWILSRLQRLTAEVGLYLPAFEYDKAIERLQSFAHHEAADWYLELAKPRINAKEPGALSVTRSVLLQTVTLLHPIMPFVTDALAEQFQGTPASLDLAPWPQASDALVDEAAERSLEALQGLVGTLRRWLRDLGLDPSRQRARLAFAVLAEGPELAFPEARRHVSTLLPIDWVEEQVDPDAPRVVAGRTTVAFAGGAGAGAEAWREAARRELRRAQDLRQSLERKLAGDFARKAPAQVVARERERLEEVRQRESLLHRLSDS